MRLGDWPMPFLKRLILLYALLIASPAMSDQFREGLRALQLKENDKDIAENIDKLKNQILYNSKENEI